MAAALPSHLFLTVGSPPVAAVQLFHKLPRDYHLVRRSLHPHLISETGLSFLDVVNPSYGSCSFVLRIATDPDYEMEMVQTRVINLRTHSGQSSSLFEERAFRIKSGAWSLWTIQGDDKAVGYKVTDLVLDEVRPPEQNGPSGQDVVQKVVLRGGPWKDAYGRNLTALTLWLGKQVRWLENHRLDQPEVGLMQFCVDEYVPEVEHEETAQDRVM